MACMMGTAYRGCDTSATVPSTMVATSASPGKLSNGDIRFTMRYTSMNAKNGHAHLLG